MKTLKERVVELVEAKTLDMPVYKASAVLLDLITSLKVINEDLQEKVKEYPATYQDGMVSIENLDEVGGPPGNDITWESLINGFTIKGNLGIQVAKDGRVWVCIDGVSFLQFTPESKYLKEKPDFISKRGSATYRSTSTDPNFREVLRKRKGDK